MFISGFCFGYLYFAILVKTDFYNFLSEIGNSFKEIKKRIKASKKFFQENNLELKGWKKLFTCRSSIIAQDYNVTFTLNRAKRIQTLNPNLISFLNDCFILRITDNNYIIDKVTDNKVSIFYNYNKTNK